MFSHFLLTHSEPAKIQSTGTVTLDSHSDTSFRPVDPVDESNVIQGSEVGTTESVDAVAYEAALLEEKRNLHAYLKSYER